MSNLMFILFIGMAGHFLTAYLLIYSWYIVELGIMHFYVVMHRHVNEVI
jgi:hypothetical protein